MIDWISVKDRLPSAEEEVLFIAPFNGAPLICFGYKNADDPEDQRWTDLTVTDSDGDGLSVYGVTHWIPLPEMPTNET